MRLVSDVVVAQFWVEIGLLPAGQTDHEESHSTEDGENDDKEEKDRVTDRIP